MFQMHRKRMTFLKVFPCDTHFSDCPEKGNFVTDNFVPLTALGTKVFVSCTKSYSYKRAMKQKNPTCFGITLVIRKHLKHPYI